MTGADLSDANLRGVSLRKAVLKDTSLRDADLTDADLDGATGLLGGQLAGADLTRAILPETARDFEELKQADRIADSGQKLYIAMLGGCAYSVLTIATTTDAKLITNSATSALPIIQTPVPIAGFFWVAPLLLAGIYFYFHLYLQRLWEALADLPAVFPDGISVDRKVDPWLLTGLVRRHVRRLASERPRFGLLPTVVVVLSAWWAVPATMVLFWSRYLRRHEWAGTVLHIGLLAAVITGAVLLHGITKATLRRSGRGGALRSLWRWGGALVLVAMLSTVSLGAIEGVSAGPRVKAPRTWVPYVMEKFFGYSVFANLADAEVSVKSSGWTDKSEIDLVTGARLCDVDLRGAWAPGVFLIKAHLKWTRLIGAKLWGAHLQATNLVGAKLKGQTSSRPAWMGPTWIRPIWRRRTYSMHTLWGRI